MGGEWRTKTLGEVCNTITDGAHQSPKSVQFGMPMASVKDLNFWGLDLNTARHISHEDYKALVRQGCKPLVGDVLIAKDGNSALDTVCVIDKPMEAVLLSSIAILRPDSTQIHSKYLKYYFMSPNVINYLKSNFISGAAIPRVILRDFKRAAIALPPLPEQRAIAHILGTLDDKIELNRRRNETLEAMARALFKDWFVDFGPVCAKMEGRDPYLPAHIWELFPDRLDDEGKPEGWRTSTIGSEVTVLGGSTPSTKDPAFWDGGEYHWATPKDLSALASPVLLETARKITSDGLSNISSGLLPAGTVLLSSRAPIGYLAIAEVPTAINQGFIAMRCDDALPKVFVLFWCRENMEAILGNASGTTFQEISKRNFRPIPVIVPAGAVLGAFRAQSDPLYRRIVTNERESRSLAQLRDTLLPKLISGELRISDAEKFVERVV